MSVCEAVAKRITNLLVEKGMTQYRFEKKSGILHGTLAKIMKGVNKTVTLSTIIMAARGFNMTLLEFLDDDLFTSDELEIE